MHNYDKVKRVYLGTDDGKHIEFALVSHGCEYCSGDNAEYQSTSYVKLSINTVLGEKVLVVESNPCPPYTNCSMKGVVARSAFRINYCPNCGKKVNYEDTND